MSLNRTFPSFLPSLSEVGEREEDIVALIPIKQVIKNLFWLEADTGLPTQYRPADLPIS